MLRVELRRKVSGIVRDHHLVQVPFTSSGLVSFEHVHHLKVTIAQRLAKLGLAPSQVEHLVTSIRSRLFAKGWIADDRVSAETTRAVARLALSRISKNVNR